MLNSHLKLRDCYVRQTFPVEFNSLIISTHCLLFAICGSRASGFTRTIVFFSLHNSDNTTPVP